MNQFRIQQDRPHEVVQKDRKFFTELDAMQGQKKNKFQILPDRLPEAVRKVRKFVRKDTKFYDVSEGTRTLPKSLDEPVLPQLLSLPPLPKEISSYNPFQFPMMGLVTLDAALQDQKRPLIFVGQPGSGKTTLIKYIATRILEGDNVPGMVDIILVLYVKCQDLPNRPTTFQNFLLAKMNLTSNEEIEVMKFIRNHPERCIILLDSIEACVKEPSTRLSFSILEGGQTSPGVVIWSLLFGELLPKSRVIATSRDIQLCLEKFWSVSKIVAILALTPELAKQICVGYLGPIKGPQAWENLTVESPYAASLCTTAVFLVYTLMARSQYSGSFRASTLASIVKSVLEDFLRSEHTRGESIESLVRGLKSMAHDGIQQNKMWFTVEDLKRHGLTSKEVGDFTSRDWPLKKILLGEDTFHFNHVSLQETLSALFVTEMEHEAFKKFSNELLYHPRNTVIWWLVCGFLFDSDISCDSMILLKDSTDFKKNKEFVSNILKKILEKEVELSNLEFLRSLHEAQHGVSDFLKNIQTIRIDGRRRQILYPGDFHVIGSVARHCKNLEELGVINANLTPLCVDALLRCVENSSFKVHKLSLSENLGLGTNGMIRAGELARKIEAKHVEFDGCELTPQEIFAFLSSIGDYTLKVLDLSWLTHTRVDDMTPDKEALQGTVHYKYDISSARSPTLPQQCVNAFMKQLEFEERVEIVQRPGLWKRAVPAFTHAVIGMFAHVTKEIKLHGWKFDDVDIISMQNYLKEREFEGLRISLTNGYVTSAHRPPSAYDERKRISCEKREKSIYISWPVQKASKCYKVKVNCSGAADTEPIFVKENNFEERNIRPSSSYQFEVQSVNIDGSYGETLLSEQVTTAPNAPVDVSARGREKDILVTWNPSTKDAVETYRVQITEDQKKLLLLEECKTSFIFKNPKPGKTYCFSISALNSFGLRGKSSESKNLTYFPVSATEPENTIKNVKLDKGEDTALKPSKLEPSKDKNDSEVWPELERVKSIDELANFLCHHQQRVEKMQIAHRSVDKETMRKIYLVISQFSDVKELELRNCNLEANLLSVLIDLLNDSESALKIGTLSITASEQVHLLLPNMCKITEICNVSGLNIEECTGIENSLLLIYDSITSGQLQHLHKLDLSYNKAIGDFASLGKILSGRVTELKLANCDLETKQLQDLSDDLHHSKVEYLDISYNADLVSEDIALLPKILAKNSSHLIMKGCELTEDDLEGFEDSDFTGMTIDRMDFSENSSIDCEGVRLIGHTVKKLGTKELNLASCSLDKESLKNLEGSFGKKETISHLDISGNRKLSSCTPVVSRLIKCSGVKSLIFSDCKLTSQQIKLFAESLRKDDVKLRRIDVSDSDRIIIDESYENAVRELAMVVEKEMVLLLPKAIPKSKENLRKRLCQIEDLSIVLEPNERQKIVEFLKISFRT